MKSTREALIPEQFYIDKKGPLFLPSEAALMKELFTNGPLTHTALTEHLELSQQSISRLASSLEKRGIVRRGKPKLSGQRGQPSVVLQLNEEYCFTIGISLMADGVAVSIHNICGEALGYDLPTLKSLHQADVLYGIEQSIRLLLKQNKLSYDNLFGIGLAITGFRLSRFASFNPPKSLDDFAVVDLEQLFSDHFKLPVWAENDGKAATIGELMNGVGRWTNNFAYFYIATGIGGGVVMDGTLVRGKRGNAGEFVGSLPLKSFPFPNLEILRQKLEARGLQIETVSKLISQFDESWPEIDEWVEEVAPSYSQLASATSAILDTEIIVLGGRMPKTLALRLIPHIEFWDIARRSITREHARVVPAECKGDPTTTGAALLPFFDKFFHMHREL